MSESTYQKNSARTNTFQLRAANSPPSRAIRGSGVLPILSALALVLFGAMPREGLGPRAAAQAPPPCVTAPAGLIGWWPGDNNANDIQGGNNGTLQNGATFATGEVDQAFSLDGADDHVLIGNPASLNSFPMGITLDAWINPTQAPPFDPSPGNNLYSIVSKWGQSAQTDAYALMLQNRDGTVRLTGAIGVPGSADTSNISLIGGEVPVGQWTHVAMTYDTSTGVNKIYINGQQVGERVRPGGITQSDLNVMIGREDSFFPRPFKGLIDEVEIFNRPLAAAEVQAIFAAGSAGKCKPGACCPSGNQCSLTVPGTSNPWLAGMPGGTDAGEGDTAPAQSPKEVDCLPIMVGDRLTFTSSGAVSNCPSGCQVTGPEGGDPVTHFRGAQFNISNLTAPVNSLVGVFLGPARPDADPNTPPPLDFSTFSSRNYDNLSPLLKQVFFIGDGRRLTTAGPLCQTVTVPPGATRLFLGTMDGFEWSNNTGAFSVRVCKLARPSFDTCLQDDSNGNQLLFNSVTGDYLFANCNGFSVTGRGAVTVKGCTITLLAERADGRVQAQLDNCVNVGKASIQIFSQGMTSTIIDRNISNSTCACLSSQADLAPDPVHGQSGAIAFCRTDANGKLVIRVKNGGPVDAPASTTRVEFSPGGVVLLMTPPIPAGGTVDIGPIGFPAVCFDPDCEFTITVDVNNNVNESNEVNNTAAGRCIG
jgi:hypothetical protein